jgi:hypothetical protein
MKKHNSRLWALTIIMVVVFAIVGWRGPSRARGPEPRSPGSGKPIVTVLRQRHSPLLLSGVDAARLSL